MSQSFCKLKGEKGNINLWYRQYIILNCRVAKSTLHLYIWMAHLSLFQYSTVNKLSHSTELTLSYFVYSGIKKVPMSTDIFMTNLLSYAGVYNVCEKV